MSKSKQIIANNSNIEADIAIIGAGPAGLFCAFQAGMLGMSSVIIDALDSIGGQCTALYPTKPIYDIPAHPVISGGELISQLMDQCAPFNPQFILSSVVTGMTKDSGSWKITTSKGSEVRSKSVIIAAGGGAFGPNRPPLDGIEAYEGKSVFYAIHDTEMFRDKKVVIAGGGDSALDWTLNLASIASKIYVVHRRNNFRGMDATLGQIQPFIEAGKVELVVPYQLHGISGADAQVTDVVVSDLDGNIKKLEADFLLPFFGLKMDIGPISEWGLSIDYNHISVDPATMLTNLPGVFAIGDIATYQGKLKLILTGFAEAALACHTAYNIVFPDKALHFQYSTSKGVPAV